MSEYLSVKTLSQYLPEGFHNTPGAIRNLVLRRAIPFRKREGRLVFIREEIDRWVKSAPGISFEELDEKK